MGLGYTGLNYVPKSGDVNMFRTDKSTEDISIESAVVGTNFTNRTTNSYNDFDSIRLAVKTAMINDSYGTRYTTPTSTNELRGYPKPTLSYTFLQEIYEPEPGTQIKQLRLTVSLGTNFVGFPITITVGGTYNLNGGTNYPVNKIKSIGAGATSGQWTDIVPSVLVWVGPEVNYNLTVSYSLPGDLDYYDGGGVGAVGTMDITDNVA